MRYNMFRRHDALEDMALIIPGLDYKGHLNSSCGLEKEHDTREEKLYELNDDHDVQSPTIIL